MPPTALPELQAALNELSARAGEAVGKFTAGLSRLSTSEAYGFAADGYPKLIDPYVASSSELTTQWYAEQPAKPTPRGGGVFVPEPAPLPPREQLSMSARWAVSRPDPEVALRGNATRLVMGGSRRTMIANALRERVRWVRVTESENPCGDCKVQAARASLEADGVWLPQDLAKFHDHCQCMAVAVRDGVYEEPARVGQWREQHAAAVLEHGSDDRAIARALDTATSVLAVGVVGVAVGGAARLAAEARRWSRIEAVGGALADAGQGAAGAAGDAAGVAVGGLKDLVLAGGPGAQPGAAAAYQLKIDGTPSLESLPLKNDDTRTLEARMGKRVGVKAVSQRDANLVNPNWKPKEESADDTWRNNCARCVTAWELRRRGYDVEATAAENGRGLPASEVASMWRRGSENGNTASWFKVQTHSVRPMKQQADNYLLTNQPDGARGFVAIGFSQAHGGGGHVFAWERVGDKVFYYEPQVPGQYLQERGFKAEDNFDLATPLEDLRFLRTDQLFASARVAEIVRPSEASYGLPPVDWLEQNSPGGFLHDGEKLPWTDENVARWWNMLSGNKTATGQKWLQQQRDSSTSTAGLAGEFDSTTGGTAGPGDLMLTGVKGTRRTKGDGPGSTPVTGEFGKVASRLPKGTEIKPVYKLNKDGTVKLSKSGKPQVDVAGTWASISDSTLDENLRLALRQAQPWAVEAGTTWYPGVRRMATRLTKQYAKSFKQQHGVDLSPDLLGGLVSVFSRNNGWIRNIVGVRQFLDDPFAEKPKKDKETGETKMVKPMHVTMTGGATNLIEFVKARREAGETDDHAIVEAFFASYPTAPKPHRFWRSIMGDEDNSAIDRWMARVQLHTDDPEFAEKMRSATKTVKGVKNNYGYHRLEASIKRISREPEFAGYTATQLQASAWVQLVGPDGVLGDIQDLSTDRAALAEARNYGAAQGWEDV